MALRKRYQDTGTPVRKRRHFFFFSSLAFSYYFLKSGVFFNWCPGVLVSFSMGHKNSCIVFDITGLLSTH